MTHPMLETLTQNIENAEKLKLIGGIQQLNTDIIEHQERLPRTNWSTDYYHISKNINFVIPQLIQNADATSGMVSIEMPANTLPETKDIETLSNSDTELSHDIQHTTDEHHMVTQHNSDDNVHTDNISKEDEATFSDEDISSETLSDKNTSNDGQEIVQQTNISLNSSENQNIDSQKQVIADTSDTTTDTNTSDKNSDESFEDDGFKHREHEICVPHYVDFVAHLDNIVTSQFTHILDIWVPKNAYDSFDVEDLPDDDEIALLSLEAYETQLDNWHKSHYTNFELTTLSGPHKQLDIYYVSASQPDMKDSATRDSQVSHTTTDSIGDDDAGFNTNSCHLLESISSVVIGSLTYSADPKLANTTEYVYFAKVEALSQIIHDYQQELLSIVNQVRRQFDRSELTTQIFEKAHSSEELMTVNIESYSLITGQHIAQDVLRREAFPGGSLASIWTAQETEIPPMPQIFDILPSGQPVKIKDAFGIVTKFTSNIQFIC